jgi:S1-C subfamily serine protease
MATQYSVFRAALAVLFWCAFPFTPQTMGEEKAAAPEPRAATEQSPKARTPAPVASFAPVVEQVAPSVVTVFTTKNVTANDVSLLDDPLLRRLFGGHVPQTQGKQKLQGLGSGVIVAADGYISARWRPARR